MNDIYNELLTVSEITGEIKMLIESEFDDVTVIGEISNFKAHFSGHWYFTLKDSSAQISCTMWKGLNSYVFFTPQDGMKVVVKGKISLYAPRGNYQIDVRSMKPAGQGELQMAYEMLKAKLSEEGLFKAEFKKSIPRFPKKIGIATAIDGAALKDMISVAKRRYPLAELIVGGCRVQGDGAANEIVKRLKQFNEQNEVDVIIVGRGGGSLEDLWAFNEEIVAREIFASEIPVISAVGHEIDFTISDFVADLRAPTPTAAMELATPDKAEIFGFINDFSYYSTENIFSKIEKNRKEIRNILNSYGFRTPSDKINNAKQTLDYLQYRFDNNMNSIFKNYSSKLELIRKTIENADIKKILRKGFTIINQNNKPVERAEKFNSGELFSIRFYDKEVKVNDE